VPKWIKFIIAVCVTAHLCGRRHGLIKGFARVRERGHDVDSVSGGRGMLAGHFFSAAEADVDLRFRT